MKLIINCEAFFAKLQFMLTKCLGGEDLQLLFKVAPKSICGHLPYMI